MGLLLIVNDEDGKTIDAFPTQKGADEWLVTHPQYPIQSEIEFSTHYEYRVKFVDA